MAEKTTLIAHALVLGGLLGVASLAGGCDPSCDATGSHLYLVTGEPRSPEFNEFGAMCEMEDWSARRRRCIMKLTAASKDDWHMRCPLRP